MSELLERCASIRRVTGETAVEVECSLDRRSEPQVRTGLGFLDHMLRTLAFHSATSLKVDATGDLEVDDHHTVEDVALCLGAAWAEALGKGKGIRRFGSAYAPLDESLARCVVDLSGRPFAMIDLGLVRPQIGTVASENLRHFWQSFAIAGQLTLHLDVIRGENDHHRCEAAFKAAALALKQAISRESSVVPSLKGTFGLADVERPGGVSA